jgi:hypothetical protein
MLPRGVENFLEDMSKDALIGPLAENFRAAFEAIDDEGTDGNADAILCIDAFSWILGHRDRGVMERIEMCDRLRAATSNGRVTINLKQFTGWR